jgi:ligand-binding sensor domain-containing protein
MPTNQTGNFCLSICLLLWAALTACPQFQIESWTTDSGLPQNTVYSIAQTPDGYLWLATLDGLVRYDGARFTVFNKNNSSGFESNRFTHLVVDASGDLWARTESGNITRRHQGAFQTYGGDDLDGKIVRRFLLNDEGNLVVFTDGGIFIRDGDKFAPYAPIAGENKDSAVFVEAIHGAFMVNSIGRTLYRSKTEQTSEYQLPAKWRNPSIVKLFEDSRGRMGSARSAGLFGWRTKTRR